MRMPTGRIGSAGEGVDGEAPPAAGVGEGDDSGTSVRGLPAPSEVVQTALPSRVNDTASDWRPTGRSSLSGGRARLVASGSPGAVVHVHAARYERSTSRRLSGLVAPAVSDHDGPANPPPGRDRTSRPASGSSTPEPERGTR